MKNYLPHLQVSGCSEISVRNHHYSLYDNSEERGSQIYKKYKLLHTSGYGKQLSTFPKEHSVIFAIIMLHNQHQFPMSISAVCQPVQYSNAVCCGQLQCFVCFIECGTADRSDSGRLYNEEKYSKNLKHEMKCKSVQWAPICPLKAYGHYKDYSRFQQLCKRAYEVCE